MPVDFHDIILEHLQSYLPEVVKVLGHPVSCKKTHEGVQLGVTVREMAVTFVTVSLIKRTGDIGVCAYDYNHDEFEAHDPELWANVNGAVKKATERCLSDIASVENMKTWKIAPLSGKVETQQIGHRYEPNHMGMQTIRKDHRE